MNALVYLALAILLGVEAPSQFRTAAAWALGFAALYEGIKKLWAMAKSSTP